MKPTRRRFLTAGLATVGSGAFLDSVAANEPAATSKASAFNKRGPTAEAPICAATVRPGAQSNADINECLDYGRSFICNTSPANAVRFWVESRTILCDDEAGTNLVMYQCGSCKSENTFAEKDLFKQDNYDFMPIYGGDDMLVLRRQVDARDSYRELRKVKDVWGEPDMRLKYGQTVRELTSFEEIRDATAAAIPLVAQTELANDDTGLRCLLEYPVKTMNISIDDSLWQVDTGPIALPDLAQRYEPAVDSVRLAFAAFNATDFCDFVIEQPTPVLRDEQAVCEVYHYSNPVSMPAKNRVLAVE